jgi:hypothetical protein
VFVKKTLPVFRCLFKSAHASKMKSDYVECNLIILNGFCAKPINCASSFLACRLAVSLSNEWVDKNATGEIQQQSVEFFLFAHLSFAISIHRLIQQRRFGFLDGGKSDFKACLTHFEREEKEESLVTFRQNIETFNKLKREKSKADLNECF